ncbi:hypothetical protein B0H12DRAFT_1075697 [Mycena haematopus]|nr:hypothetical protein B0H12DRAFT_1075697 [Mycena haematopus]
MSTRPAKRRRTKNAPKARSITRSDKIWHSDGSEIPLPSPAMTPRDMFPSRLGRPLAAGGPTAWSLGEGWRGEKVCIVGEPCINHGSVVLQAEQTQWKVHWTVLALHSSYFRDLQAQPHPPKSSDIDGCPVIELSDDAQDVEDVLKALYIPTFHSKKKLPLPVVRAFIRLGRKYNFKDLVESAITRIMSEAPTTLEEWDTLKDRIGFRSFEDFDGMELDLITLASENSLLPALPCLYYRAVELWSPGELFEETEAEDATFVSLPRVDLRRCLEGRQNILKAQFRPGYTYAWPCQAWCTL